MKIDAREWVKGNVEMTVEVRVVNLRWVKIRLWIALRLCILAAWIGGYGLKINQEVGVIITNTDVELREQT